MSSAAAIKLAPDPKERHEFGFRALRKIKLDDGEGEGHEVPKTTPFQVERFAVIVKMLIVAMRDRRRGFGSH